MSLNLVAWPRDIALRISGYTGSCVQDGGLLSSSAPGTGSLTCSQASGHTARLSVSQSSREYHEIELGAIGMSDHASSNILDPSSSPYTLFLAIQRAGLLKITSQYQSHHNLCQVIKHIEVENPDSNSSHYLTRKKIKRHTKIQASNHRDYNHRYRHILSPPHSLPHIKSVHGGR